MQKNRSSEKVKNDSSHLDNSLQGETLKRG